MDAPQEKSYEKLILNLDELTKLYRSLLDVIRKEKEILVEANLQKLDESNKTKEMILHKIRSQDSARERYAKEFAQALGMTGQEALYPRLLELAKTVQGDAANRLRTIHATLEILVKRCSDLNRENETSTQTALKNLNGALNNIKDTLGGKKTYSRQGTMAAAGPDKAGNFVSKES